MSGESPSSVDRPGTVTAAGAILYVSAALLLFIAGAVFLFFAGKDPSAEVNTLRLLLTAVVLGAAVVSVVLAYFIMRGKRWAQIVSITLAVVSIIFGAVNVVSGEVQSCVGIGLNIAMIALLGSPSANRYFRHH